MTIYNLTFSYQAINISITKKSFKKKKKKEKKLQRRKYGIIFYELQENV